MLQDPEGSAMTKTEGSRTRLQQLLTLLEDGDKRVQELGMISLLAVFKDVLPSYRIRLPTEKELAQKVSKDVKRLRDYERALLAAYQVRRRAEGGCLVLHHHHTLIPASSPALC